MLNKF
jgi:hypothetical protein